MRFVAQRRAAAILFHLARSRSEKEGVYLVPANACPVVPLAILAAGRQVEFVDISRTYLAMCRELVRARLCDASKPPVAGVVFIRPYGAIEEAAIDFNELRRQSGNTVMIDDRCAAVPELSPDRLASGADMYLYSTGYGKYVDLGEGGYAFLKPSITYQDHWKPPASFSEQDYRRLESRWKLQLSSRRQGKFWDSETKALGWLDSGSLPLNPGEYMDTIHRRIGAVKRQKALADQIYRSLIPDSVFIGEKYNDWRHQILVHGKFQLLDSLFANALFASGHYDTTARLFSDCAYHQSDHLYSRIVNLFNDFNLTADQMVDIARLVGRHVEQRQ